MTDNYVRRMNYSNGQRLDVADFDQEQRYHLDQRRRHNKQVHGWGIVTGLEVELTDDATDLLIRPGAALDNLGREIVLTGPDPEPVKLKAQVPPLRSTTVYLVLAYHDEDDTSAEWVVKDAGNERDYSRRRVERPSILKAAAPVDDGSAITLARVTIDATGKLAVDASVRTRSGGLHPDTGLAVQRALIGQRIGLGASGGAGLLSFTSVEAPGASADGITWFAAQPADYGIHRTAGAWSADTGYQQLRVRWLTGIVLDPGTEHDKSWVEVQGKGLRVSAGGIALGASYTSAPDGTLLVEARAGIGVVRPEGRLDIAGKGDKAGDLALQLRSGNTARNTASTQVAFAFDSGSGYRHAIKTRHNSSGRSGNAIDFHVWRWASATDRDKDGDIGTQHALTLDGGNVGIGTDDPGEYRLKVAGGDSSFAGSVGFSGKASFGSGLRQMVDLYDTTFGIGIQSNTVYFRSAGNFAWFRGGEHNNAVLTPGGPADKPGKMVMVITGDKVGIGATGPQAQLDVEGDAIVSGPIKGRFSDTAELKKTRAARSFISDDAIGVISRQNAAVLQGWGFGATAQPAKCPPHLFTIGYQADGTAPGNIFVADLNTGALKTFAIDHPLHADRYLMHATLEGPEGAVYYRGSARLVNGRAEICLPPYFEALTRATGRTVLLTNVDGWDPIAVLTQGGATIRDGRFVVASSQARSQQAFDWEVKAVRSDARELEVEPARHSTRIERFGPYAYRKG